MSPELDAVFVLSNDKPSSVFTPFFTQIEKHQPPLAGNLISVGMPHEARGAQFGELCHRQ